MTSLSKEIGPLTGQGRPNLAPIPAVINLWAADICLVCRDQGWEFRTFLM